MRARLFSAFLVLAFSGPALRAVPYQFDFANLTAQGSSSRVRFDGNTDSFTFLPGSGARDFVITNSDFGELDGLFGRISGSFFIGAIASFNVPGLGLVQDAPVTGSGQFSIFDGSGSITADLSWMNIQTLGTFGAGLNTSGLINLSNFTGYTGSNQRLQSFLSNDGSVVMSLSFQNADLSSLVLDGTVHDNDFSGSASVESSAVADSSLGWSVAVLWLGVVVAARFRSRGFPA